MKDKAPIDHVIAWIDAKIGERVHVTLLLLMALCCIIFMQTISPLSFYTWLGIIAVSVIFTCVAIFAALMEKKKRPKDDWPSGL